MWRRHSAAIERCLWALLVMTLLVIVLWPLTPYILGWVILFESWRFS